MYTGSDVYTYGTMGIMMIGFSGRFAFGKDPAEAVSNANKGNFHKFKGLTSRGEFLGAGGVRGRYVVPYIVGR